MTIYQIEPKITVIQSTHFEELTYGMCDCVKMYLTGEGDQDVLFLTDRLSPENVIRLLRTPDERVGHIRALSDENLSRITARRFIHPDDITPQAIMEILYATRPIGMVAIDSLQLSRHDIPKAKWLLYELAIKAGVEIAVGLPAYTQAQL